MKNMYLCVVPVVLGMGLLAACGKEETTSAPEAPVVEAPAAPAPAAEPAVKESAADVATAFRTFLDENYAVDMDRAPYTASYRGIKTRHGEWNSVAESHQEETRKLFDDRLAALEEFDKSALDPMAALSWDLYQQDLERRIASDEFRHHKFVIHQFRGPHTQAASNLINIHRVNDVADAEAYISRLI